jgi:hypothetical protein
VPLKVVGGLEEAFAVYKVIQKERSLLWEVIVSVVVIKIRMNKCRIVIGYRDRAA